jgi:hypothetical protein
VLYYKIFFYCKKYLPVLSIVLAAVSNLPFTMHVYVPACDDITGSKTSLLSTVVGALGEEKSRGESSLYHIMSSPGNQLAPQSKANKRFSIAVTV